MPGLSVTPESLLSRVGEAFGFSDIHLESEDFNRRFRVRAPDPKFAYDVLSPDVDLVRRHDLVPNLVETVKGYAAHERAVLESVTAARTEARRAAADGSVGPREQARVETALQRSLGGLFAVAENYPTLKADTQFLELQRQLAETEDRIAAARRFYNGNVRALNTRVEAFPSSLVASAFHFGPAGYFETDDPAVYAPVAVDFSAAPRVAADGPPSLPTGHLDPPPGS